MNNETLGLKASFFLPTTAPFHPTASATTGCIQLLKDRGILTKKGTWKAFRALPAQLRGTRGRKRKTEAQIYGGIDAICEAIASYDYPGRTATCRYVDKPDSRTDSEIPGGSYRSDGSFQLRDPDLVVLPDEGEHTSNVACGSYYKVEDSELNVQLNRDQVVSAANFEMNNDPIRNHTYSMSIENGQVSFWYWARSHSVKVEEFSFLDVKMFVACLMSIIFATREELGYNPHMFRRRDAECNIIYVFELKGRYFKSLDIIFENRTTNITGRATRVWRVQEIMGLNDLRPKPGTKEQVLKDVWLDEGARTEKEIQTAIFDDLDAFIAALPANRESFFANPPEALKGASRSDLEQIYECFSDRKYRKHFVSIDDDFDDTESITKPIDFKTSHFRSGPGFYPRHNPRGQRVSLPSGSRAQASSNAANREEDSSMFPANFRQYRQKRRCLVLYNPVCVALEYMTDLVDVFDTIEGGLTALQLMSIVDWIHRDISSGNVMGLRGPDKKMLGKLGDLEYAKKTSLLPPADSSPDPKTGTPFYMAVEIQQGTCHKNKPRDVVLQDGESGDESDETEGVVHTVFHDLESFLWLSLRFVTDCVDHAPSRSYACKIFTHITHWSKCPLAKYEALFIPKRMKKALVKHLHGCFGQGKTKGLAYWFEQLRRTLVNYYAFRDSEGNRAGLGFQCAFELVRNVKQKLSEPEDGLSVPTMIPLIDQHNDLNRLLGNYVTEDDPGTGGPSKGVGKRDARYDGHGAASRSNKTARTSHYDDVTTSKRHVQYPSLAENTSDRRTRSQTRAAEQVASTSSARTRSATRLQRSRSGKSAQGSRSRTGKRSRSRKGSF